MSCITRWFSTQTTGSCPICRKEMEGLGEMWKDPVNETWADNINNDDDQVVARYINHLHSQVSNIRAIPLEVNVDEDIDQAEDRSEGEDDFLTEMLNEEADIMNHRISLNESEFYDSSINCIYNWEVTEQILDAWNGVVRSEFFDSAPPNFPSEKRYYFSYKELRCLFLASSHWDLMEDYMWRLLYRQMRNPKTHAFTSMSFEYPIKLPDYSLRTNLSSSLYPTEA